MVIPHSGRTSARNYVAATRASAALQMSKRKASSEPPAVSSRAARTGRGAVGLNEAAGSLDADYETLGVLGRGNF